VWWTGDALASDSTRRGRRADPTGHAHKFPSRATTPRPKTAGILISTRVNAIRHDTSRRSDKPEECRRSLNKTFNSVSAAQKFSDLISHAGSECAAELVGERSEPLRGTIIAFGIFAHFLGARRPSERARRRSASSRVDATDLERPVISGPSRRTIHRIARGSDVDAWPTLRRRARARRTPRSPRARHAAVRTGRSRTSRGLATTDRR